MRVSYIYARLEGKSSPLKQQLMIFPTTFPIFLLFLQYFQQTKFSGFFFDFGHCQQPIYRKWTKYSNPFYPVQPPRPQSSMLL